MQRMFGVPVEQLAVVLTVIVATGVAILVALALRNIVFFRLGARNIGRRRGRSALIVVGLMLATTIIASALGTGDTMGRTMRASVFKSLGTTDETIAMTSANDNGRLASQAGTTIEPFDATWFPKIDRVLRAGGSVDGVAPAIIDTVAAQDTTSRQTEPRLGLFASDARYLDGFAPITNAAGRRVSLADLHGDGVFIDQAGARKLHAKAGDSLYALIAGRPIPVHIADIVQFRGSGTDSGAILMPLARAQDAFAIGNQIKQVLVSNRGGETSGVGLTDQVAAQLRPVLTGHGLEVNPVKRDGIDAAETAGNTFMQMFSTFGMFSISAGILLIFLIFVMLAAERRTEMGVARALGTRRGHLVQTFLFEGAIYDIAAAAIGALLGIALSLVMITAVGNAFSSDQHSLDIVYSVRWSSIIVAYMLGVAITLLVVALSAWRVSVVNIVTAIRNLNDPPKRRGRRGRYAAIALGLLGVLLVFSGRSSGQMISFMIGVSLVLIALSALLRAFGVSDRVAYSIAGFGIVVLWLLPFRVLEQAVPKSQMNFSMWVVGGLLVVVGATWAVVYNADFIANALSAVLGRIRGLGAILRVSMAYPLRTRLRTGMTLAMFTLVVFTLVVGASTTSAFLKAFGNVEQFSGGFDVRAATSAASPITDMPMALRRTPGINETDVAAVGAQSYIPVEVRQSGTNSKFVDYPIRGLDDTYLQHTTYQLATRARGYSSDRDVWNAVRDSKGLAVVDSFIVPHRRNWSFGSMTDLQLRDMWIEDHAFTPVPLDVRDPQTGKIMRVTVIGVLRDGAPLEAAGVSVSQRSVASFGNRATPTLFYFKLASGVDPQQFADRMESAFLANGLVADSFKKVVDDATAASVLMDWLMFGFMGLGLVVGVAALGVIAARSVVERRQQIGVLRAIGFQARAIRAGFLIESGFIALTSIVVGSILGLIMAFNVVDDASRQATYGTVPHVVPYGMLALVFAIVLFVSLATTYLPARRASRVYAAEALRYQ
ncbi:MAG TPA: FtsX-like permease family protein [Acidimicrobiia bacterium]|nr:FtsX-like permease family protein [Acidimicrobiia bacterium]